MFWCRWWVGYAKANHSLLNVWAFWCISVSLTLYCLQQVFKCVLMEVERWKWVKWDCRTQNPLLDFASGDHIIIISIFTVRPWWARKLSHHRCRVTSMTPGFVVCEVVWWHWVRPRRWHCWIRKIWLNILYFRLHPYSHDGMMSKD